MILVRQEPVDIEVALAGFVAEHARRPHVLGHKGWRHGPVVIDVVLQGDAPADRIDLVEVLLHQTGIAERRAGKGEGPRGEGVVDIARIMFGEADDAHRSVRRERNIDEAFGDAALAAVIDRVSGHIITGREARRVRFVGDDAQGARFGAGAIERSLRTRQNFNPRYVIDMHVQGSADGRQRLFIEIGADAGLGSGVVVIAAVRDAAHVDDRLVGARALELNARHIFHIVLKADDVQLCQGLGIQRLDAHRHLLDVFRALLRGHDHLAHIRDLGAGGLGGVGRALGQGRGRGQHGGGQKQGPAREAVTDGGCRHGRSLSTFLQKQLSFALCGRRGRRPSGVANSRKQIRSVGIRQLNVCSIRTELPKFVALSGLCCVRASGATDHESRHDVALNLVGAAIDRGRAVVQITRHCGDAVSGADRFPVGVDQAQFRLVHGRIAAKDADRKFIDRLNRLGSLHLQHRSGGTG